MSDFPQISLIDSDDRRRAAVSHTLAGNNIHVEPFDGIGEFLAHIPKSGMVLMHDDNNTIIDLMNAMFENGKWLPVVGFHESPSTDMIVEAVQKGAIDYIAWPPTDDIVATLDRAYSKAGWMSGTKQREAVARSKVSRLSRRERQVLTGVADGLSNRMIAERLSISPRTVEIHRANMLTKMGANHTSEAIRIAIEAAVEA